MSDSVSFEWDFSEIIEGLEQMGEDIEKIEKNATKRAAKVVAEQLKKNTPRSDVDYSKHRMAKYKDYYKHMQDSIKTSGLKEDKETLDSYRGVGFGSLQYKANFLEFGTSKMQPTGFITKTMKETENEVKKIIDEELKKVIEK